MVCLAAALAGAVRPEGQFSELPLAFEPNVGQADPQVRFLARAPGMTVFFTGTEAVMVLHKSGTGRVARSRRRDAIPDPEREIVRMKLVGAEPSPPAGLERLPGVSNYFIGNDPKQWRTNVPNYARIRYADVYPGIDMLCYGQGRRLEYDLIVAPGADPRRIELAWEGNARIRLNAEGDVVLATRLGEIVQKRPRVYQESGDRRVPVAAGYALHGEKRVTFDLAAYDHSLPLVIDPVMLVYSTYVGGSTGDDAFTVAVDSTGAAHAAGFTDSIDFPLQSPFQSAYHGNRDVFVTKLSPAGNALVYSTYLGGSGEELPGEIAVDAAFSAYIAGETTSANFPVLSAYQSSLKGGRDAFVAKLAPDGNALMYSTYLGGSGDDSASCIVVDSTQSAYVTGYTESADFPLQSAFQRRAAGGRHAFVTKLSPAGNTLAYSTYLGGSREDEGVSIAVDGAGSAYVAGGTASSDFPILAAYQSTLKGNQNVFVTRLAPAGDALAYSTYLGGSRSDWPEGIAVDRFGAAYVTGVATSTDFPTQSPFQAAHKDGTLQDVFVTKLAPAGNALVYSTYLGGAGDESPYGVAVDTAGAAYVAGCTTSTNFPTQSPFQATHKGGTAGQAQDAFVTKFVPAGNALAYSTYLGGTGDDVANYIAVDAAGTAYVAGFTTSGDFPTQSPYQASNHAAFSRGYSNAFVTKLQLPVAVATNPAGLAMVVDGASQTSPQAFDWAGGTSHSIAVTSPQTGAGARYAFANWSDGGGQSHSVTVPSSAVTYTANFAAQYQLTMATSPPAGGTVTADPVSADGYYNSGSSIQVTAKANPGYQFDKWGGDVAGSANPQALAMSAARNLTAVFIAAGPAISSVVDGASGQPVIAPNSFVSIYGSGFTSFTGDWSGAIQNGALPTTLGGVQVRINGKDCYLSYARSDQLNVLTPYDTASGPVTVEVITAERTVSATATMAPVAPVLFGYNAAGRFYVSALFANTGVYVAPAGILGSTASRPATAGDYVQMYAAGLGATNPLAPAGRVLDTVYPIDDLSRLKVRFGSVDVPVLWAGLVFPGLFQVNVQVPSGLSGDVPVVLTMDGRPTQASAFLRFQ
jgi:uncharacterized protein (TIGR03437 family)